MDAAFGDADAAAIEADVSLPAAIAEKKSSSMAARIAAVLWKALMVWKMRSGEMSSAGAVSYFHVVFTLPAALADIAYHNKAVIYDLLFKASAETMITIAADPKHLGSRIGITAMLHSWGSAMTHHPYVHMIVPGGGITLDGERWISCRPNFFLPSTLR